MQNTEEVLALLVGHKSVSRKQSDTQLFCAWVLNELLTKDDPEAITRIIEGKQFERCALNVFQALLLARDDWATVFRLIDEEFSRLCRTAVEEFDASKDDIRDYREPKVFCHNALVAAMKAAAYLLDIRMLTGEKEKQFFQFLITTSFDGNYPKVIELEEYLSGMMSNCSGKLANLPSAHEYFKALQEGAQKPMSGCGKQIASEFCLKRFVSMPLPTKIQICSPQPGPNKTRKK